MINWLIWEEIVKLVWIAKKLLNDNMTSDLVQRMKIDLLSIEKIFIKTFSNKKWSNRREVWLTCSPSPRRVLCPGPARTTCPAPAGWRTTEILQTSTVKSGSQVRQSISNLGSVENFGSFHQSLRGWNSSEERPASSWWWRPLCPGTSWWRTAGRRLGRECGGKIPSWSWALPRHKCSWHWDNNRKIKE